VIRRSRLIERLNEGLRRTSGVTLISAPAGFGKTTLVSEWIHDLRFTTSYPVGDDDLRADATSESQPVNSKSKIPTGHNVVNRAAWLSLDEGDNDLTRFLAYLIAALQTIAPHIGAGLLTVLYAPQPPPPDSILTALLNDITTVSDRFILVLDDYHVIETKAVDQALAFLIEHLPPQLHLVIATRQDPNLPLARLRVRDQLTELRATDLRFTPTEAAAFLNQMMGLNLSAEDITALETRTEGWIAGLQLAAISMQGHQDATGFIQSFTGSHRFVMDYLVEEVLHQQPESVQTFLLRTSILNRMCGPLCEAVVLDPTAAGQATLEYLERANLFIVPLDNERRWYRYHHLFADLLRQRLHQRIVSSMGSEARSVAELHIRASIWYEDNSLEIEAFHHATAANDIERAERLIEGEGMLLHFRGAVGPILNWLESLPAAVLDARPSLWTTYASVALGTGRQTDVEPKLRAAEAALQGAELNDKTKDLIGRIAAIRATVAANQRQVETIITQSRRAMEFLHPNNLFFRTFTIWKLGYAYHLQGDRVEAGRAYTEAITIRQASGNTITTILAHIGLGIIQETDNRLPLAAQTYQRVLQLIDDLPLPVACEAHLGLARIYYEWNDLPAAQQSLQRAQQIENTDRVVSCEVFLACLKLTQGDVSGAAASLTKADQLAQRHNAAHRLPEVAAAQVLTLLRQRNPTAAAQVAEKYALPLSQARVHLAQGDPAAALAALGPFRRQVAAKSWADEQLKALVLQAVAYQAQGEQAQAGQVLGEALTLAEPGGFIRLFVDEGQPMVRLLKQALAQNVQPAYVHRLLAAFPTAASEQQSAPRYSASESDLVEPLSEREVEVLQLIAEGLTNQEVATKLYLSLHTVKVHARNIYGKLGVKNRTQAVARARALGILSRS
jgi:LuxR family maltose regulon positive regulatory protein